MKKTNLAAAFLLLLSACGGSASRGENTVQAAADTVFVPQYPYTLDLSSRYSDHSFRLQDYADVEYVRLETGDASLLGKMGEHWYALTDDCIFVRDLDRVYRFTRDGRFLNTIGIRGKGPGEYGQISDVDCCPETREIFFYDILLRKVLVYNFDGRFVRGFNIPARLSLENLAPVDDSTLLYAAAGYSWGDAAGTGITHYLVDSRTGKTRETYRLHTPASFRPYRKQMEGGAIMELAMPVSTKISVPGAVLANDISCDTVYAFDAASSRFAPRYLLLPKEKINYGFGSMMVFLQFETPRYACFVVSTLNENESLMGYLLDKKTNTTVRGWLLDDNLYGGKAVSQKITRVPDPLLHTIALARDGKTVARLLQSSELLTALEEGRLAGQLKTIAETLGEEDNPVLAIIRFRE